MCSHDSFAASRLGGWRRGAYPIIGASSTYKATILHEHHQTLRHMIKTAKDDGSSEVESELTEVQLLFEDISSILSNVK